MRGFGHTNLPTKAFFGYNPANASVGPTPPGPFAPVTNPSVGSIIGLAYGNGRLMLLDDAANVFTSSDVGVTWTPVTSLPVLPGSAGTNQLMFFGGSWYAFPGDATVWKSTNNGTSWVLTSSAILATSNFAFASGDGTFLIVYGTTGGETGVSTDGITWNYGTYPGGVGWSTLTSGPFIPLWDGSNYVTTGQIAGVDQIARTPDGVSFVNTPMPAVQFNVYTKGQGFFFAAGGSDGSYHWANTLAGLPAAPMTFIPGGTNPVFIALFDGTKWTAFETFGITLWENNDPANDLNWTSPGVIPGFINPTLIALAGNKWVLATSSVIIAQ